MSRQYSRPGEYAPPREVGSFAFGQKSISVNELAGHVRITERVGVGCEHYISLPVGRLSDLIALLTDAANSEGGSR